MLTSNFFVQPRVEEVAEKVFLLWELCWIAVVGNSPVNADCLEFDPRFAKICCRYVLVSEVPCRRGSWLRRWWESERPSWSWDCDPVDGGLCEYAKHRRTLIFG